MVIAKTMHLPVLLAIALMFLVFLSLSSVHNVYADSITTPLNNSNLVLGHTYNITIDITSITTVVTSDSVNLSVNGSLIYQHTYTANGLYQIPVQFNNYGVFSMQLATTTSHTTLYYTITKPVYYQFSKYFTYFSFIIILWIIGLTLLLLDKKVIKTGFLGDFGLMLVSVFSLIYILQNPTININIYYLSLALFTFAFFGSVAMLLRRFFNDG